MNDVFGFRSQIDPLLFVLFGSSDVSMEPLTEGDLEALPVGESAGSDFETTAGFSNQHGFFVDWGLFVPAACLSAALSSFSLAFVVAEFLPCGPALSPESWRQPGYCSQPRMLCRCFWGMWGLVTPRDDQGLEGLVGASLVQQMRLSTCAASSFSLRQPQQQLRRSVGSPISPIGSGSLYCRR